MKYRMTPEEDYAFDVSGYLIHRNVLSSDEVSALLTIDVSLESEALPFDLSEYWVQPGSDDGEGSDDSLRQSSQQCG